MADNVQEGRGREEHTRAQHSKAQHSTSSVAAAGRIASKQTVQVRKTPLWNRKDGRPKRSRLRKGGGGKKLVRQ